LTYSPAARVGDDDGIARSEVSDDDEIGAPSKGAIAGEGWPEDEIRECGDAGGGGGEETAEESDGD